MIPAAVGYFGVVTAMSLICFIAYWLDKVRANSGGRRVPENTLHWLAFLGGWPGALMAQSLLRHKTQKTIFRIAFWLIVVLHVSIVSGVAYLLVSTE